MSLTATLTNDDVSAATATGVTSSNIATLSLGAMAVKPGTTTDNTCTATAGATSSFYAAAAVTNKTTSANSNTAIIYAATKPRVAFQSSTIDSVTFRFYNDDASAGTIYATFNGETKNTGSLANNASNTVYVDLT